MFRSTFAVLALAAFIYPIAALPLEARDPQDKPNPGGPGIGIPGISIPGGQNGQGGFQIGTGGFQFGNPENGGGGVTWGPDGLKISPGNGQGGISIGTGQPPAQPAPKPPRRVLDDQDLSLEDD
ncbi:hypothetical protein PspLS_08717 [Pyricularia sp. CBS 133598]|nr:hypothetical protein PspLS_08717 [Pyricularia sp. CBS 133598]